jgi:hypothetical protein
MNIDSWNTWKPTNFKSQKFMSQINPLLKIIVDQVTHRDKFLAEQELLLSEQQTMINKIRDIEEQLTESRLDTEPIKSLNSSKFILQIPGITENYKQHLDKVKVLSDLQVCRCDEKLKAKDEGSRRLTYTGFRGGLENLKIETRLIDERFESVMGECVIVTLKVRRLYSK